MDIPVIHTMEFLAELIDEGKLKMTKSVDAVVTYHDPCHLGRHSGIYDAPRKVLQAIPGVKFVEMEKSRENSWCCGAGGGVKTAFPEITDKLSKKRIEQVMRTGADILTSACPFCYQTLDGMAKNMKVDFETADIVELVERAL
jgi:heterodisulfide reductase subunit D